MTGRPHGTRIAIDHDYVCKQVGALAKDTNLPKFIL
jgi:ATP-dependent protease HslVU (ClpYQ) ATPase subunit